MKLISRLTVGILLLLVFSGQAITSAFSPALIPATPGQEAFLDAVAQKTWAYLQRASSNGLPWSWSWTDAVPSGGGSYANPTEIGLYLLANIGAHEMQKSWSPSETQVQNALFDTLTILRGWQTDGTNAYANAVFYQVYDVDDPIPHVNNDAYARTVPSIDNAFLAASLMTIREWAGAHGMTDVQALASDILAGMNFRLWFRDDTDQFQLGATEDPLGGGPADYYSNENRLINFVAFALGDLLLDDGDDDGNELTKSLDALTQAPATYDRGTGDTSDDITVEKVAWDGSLFTYLAPALFLRELEDERDFDDDYGIETINRAVAAQIAYAEDEGYTGWGLSDAFTICDLDEPSLGVMATPYIEQGAPPTGMSAPNLPDDLEMDPGVITPHASALALITAYIQDGNLAGEAAANLQQLATFGGLYNSRYGFADSIMLRPGDSHYGRVSCRYSALAQAYILLSIAEYKTGFIWDYLYLDTEVQVAHQLGKLSCSLGPSNPLTAAVDNLENNVLDWGSFCDGSTPLWAKRNIETLTPSGDMTALECSLVGDDEFLYGYSKLHCYRNLLPEPNAQMFTLDLAFKFDETTCNNSGSDSLVQALEFSMSKWLNAERFEFAIQWENVYSGIGDGDPPQWRYWDGANWVVLDPPVNQCLSGDLSDSADNWHTLRLEGAIVNNEVAYRSFMIDGVEHLLAVSVPPVADASPDYMAVAVQLDANKLGKPYDVLVDNMHFVRWTQLLDGLRPAAGETVIDQQPTFTWDALAGAVRYEAQLGLSEQTGITVYSGTGRQFRPCSVLTEGTWYWRVRGIDAQGHASPWTLPQSFTIIAPTDDKPARNIMSTPTTLTWNRVSWATNYEIQLNLETFETSANSQMLPLPLNPGLYCWRMRAQRENG